VHRRRFGDQRQDRRQVRSGLDIAHQHAQRLAAVLAERDQIARRRRVGQQRRRAEGQRCLVAFDGIDGIEVGLLRAAGEAPGTQAVRLAGLHGRRRVEGDGKRIGAVVGDRADAGRT
jgi:hypothetical protein